MGFKSLYARLMVIFFAVMLAAMGMLSVLLTDRIRTDKMETRLDELTTQARDIAFLAGQLSDNSSGTTRYLMWKSQEIMRDFDAYILIIDRYRQIIPIGDQTVEFTYDFTVEETLKMLGKVVSGGEVRERTVLESGNPVFTVGVPYIQDGYVLGAVFIHTSEQSIEGTYSGIIKEVVRSMLLTLAIGAVLILIVSQVISRPLRAMAKAAERYAHGDFSKRVMVESRDEVGKLAEAFNSMADDLDRLEQTRRGFVANVSHELRSPLTSMQGFIGGILDGTVPEEEREHYLNIVLDETRRLNKLITTLLDLSHMDSGTKALTMTSFDIGEMICRVLFRHETRINDKHMDVQLDLPDEGCYVMADPDRIEQVLINLIDNAVKYGNESGVITLSAACKGDTATVTVHDDGGSIPAEDLPFVFDRFYKVDKAHTSGLGTGLGLSIVKTIIDQHGQQIEVTSSPADGTTFTFTLSRANGDHPAKR